MNINDMPEVECESCGWQGNANEANDDCCPECGSGEVVDYEPEEDEAGNDG